MGRQKSRSIGAVLTEQSASSSSEREERNSLPAEQFQEPSWGKAVDGVARTEPMHMIDTAKRQQAAPAK